MTNHIDRINAALGAMSDRPRALVDYLKKPGPDFEMVGDNEVDDLLALILSPDPNNTTRIKFANLLRSWDNAKDGEWIGQSARNTSARRALVHALLKTNNALIKRIDSLLPYYSLEEPLIIAEDHADWYVPKPGGRDYYWRTYLKYLRERCGWGDVSLLNLDNSTRSILECLSNPESTSVYSSRGLVMGYVQSGKTANFAGLVARAADAGYRLIIVLAGTWNILRNQTQRRFDKELLGKEFLENDDTYRNQRPADWNEFLEHGAYPPDLGHYSWQRLTRPDIDFRGLKAAIDSLEYEKRHKHLPLYHPDNLHHLPVKLLVVKKNSIVLQKLAGDLTKLRTRLVEIPALVIDDESDQAGLNTIDPSKAVEGKERTAVNRGITHLLKLLQRGQYVGYSATPYANALVNPDDPEDLFPKDFIVSLDRPIGYMGVSDFFDPFVDFDDLKKDEYAQPELAFIRRVDASQADDDDDLKRALRSYVLSGAIKLYRLHKDADRYRPEALKHHTMLIHTSSRKGVHATLAERIVDLWDQCAFNSPDGLGELRKLWESDFQPVCQAQGKDELFPTSFNDLKPHLSISVQKITRNAHFVRVVNSDRDEAPDFTQGPVWLIVVGGNKLSRGYTIEGLTVSYYRRVTSTADTLMQMGRWFGFRPGYRDLVRVFLGVNEGKDQSLDLVSLFKEVCRMEERFRNEIKRYIKRAGAERITPRRIPPLIEMSGNLLPTAHNKMFNARIDRKNFGAEWFMPTLLPVNRDNLDRNIQTLSILLKNSERLSLSSLDGTIVDTSASAAIAASLFRTMNEGIMKFLADYHWIEDQYKHPQRPTDVDLLIEFLGKPGHGITSWLVIAPQKKESFGKELKVGGYIIKVKKRSRNGRGFKVIGESLHRTMAEYLADLKKNIRDASAATKGLVSNHNAIMLLYPVRETEDHDVSIGFEMLFPANDLPYDLGFTVRCKSESSKIVVSRTRGAPMAADGEDAADRGIQ